MNISLKRLSLAIAGAGLLTIYGCGGGGGGSSSSLSTPPSSTPPSSAVLNDAPVKGVCYSASPSGLHGVTDAAGAYQYQAGDNVSFWIDVSGSTCGTTPANRASTTAIALGSVIPGTASAGTTVQTFILSLDTGPQAAQTLQALNHGTASSMDVSGITLPAAQVTAVNTYLASKGDTSLITGAPSVFSLFDAVQRAATVASAPLQPTLPATATFEASVTNNLAHTVASGLGAAPTTFTIPANRIVFSTSSGTQTTNAITSPFNNASIVWFDGNGNGKRFVKPANLTTTITIANVLSTIGSVTQPFTYSISGNVVSKAVTINNGAGSAVGSINDATTIQYTDDHGAFYSGTSTKTPLAGLPTTNSYSGSNIRLTPLTASMLAGKTLTLEAPGCPNGVSIDTYSADGTTAQNTNCGPGGGIGEIRTNVASSIPGIVQSSSTGGTAPDQSIILVGLDGASVSVGSALVILTLNSGGGDFPAWGRMKIVAVN